MDSMGFYVKSRQKIVKKNRIELRNKASQIFDLPDSVFTQRFRLNKAAFKYVLRELKQKLPPIVRSSSVSAELKLAACLRFLANGGYQDGVGQDFNFGMAQSTISVVLSDVLAILEEQLCPKWITLAMTDEEKRDARVYFYRKCKIPGVIMCMDGIHIKIVKPNGESSHQFLNQKGFFSLNAIIICDHKQRIRYVDAKYPGSTQNAFVWSNSEAYLYFKELYENGDCCTRLLGYEGYPLSPWLITPFKDACAGTAESRFNESHSSALNVIKQTVGAWRNWCRCFLGTRQLHYSPKKAVQIINVAAALHNIRIHFKLHQDYDPDSLVEEEGPEDEVFNEEYQTEDPYFEEAIQLRNEFLSNF
ncbi:putative nuclease HARBI1 [Eupeodes corollae]|uniref:putative nuclease HARBI1 n=1 Tax=Eupeodes corollae TaxID=290404 RepID=UPI0024907498|nr:putative nuclease HARBI1 [Eupeodes corollae]